REATDLPPASSRRPQGDAVSALRQLDAVEELAALGVEDDGKEPSLAIPTGGCEQGAARVSLRSLLGAESVCRQQQPGHHAGTAAQEPTAVDLRSRLRAHYGFPSSERLDEGDERAPLHGGKAC